MPSESRPTPPSVVLPRTITPSRTPLRIVDDTDDDASLIEAVAAGNASRAVVLYDRLRPVVSRTIRRLAPRSTEHEDLVQQTFMELVVSLRARPQVRSLDAWAATIAARTVYQRLRRVKLEARFAALGSTDDDSEAPVEHPSNPSDGPLLTTLRRQALRRVSEVLALLNPSRVQVFLLHDVHGFELKEIADILAITVANAQSRLVRGRNDVHIALNAEPELLAALREEAGR
ncbi:MAG: RNA polymerase sigma factor [Archangium sp.]|nr:RNA polymerase sigma factor [Archangium sp.]